MAELGGHGACAPEHLAVGKQAGAHALAHIDVGEEGLLNPGEGALGVGETGGIVQDAQRIIAKGLTQPGDDGIGKIHPHNGGQNALALAVHNAGNHQADP